jgi:hypothetical protein
MSGSCRLTCCQKPRLLAGRRQTRPVQRTAATDRGYGGLVVEIKRLVPAQRVGSGWIADLHQSRGERPGRLEKAVSLVRSEK